MDIPRLILEFYRCAHECDAASFQDTVLRTLQGALHFDAGKWGIGRIAPDGIHFLCAHLFHDDPEAPLLYESISLQDTAALRALASPGMPARFHAESEFGAASQKALLDYKRRFRHANGLITVLPGQDGTVQSLSLYRHAPNQHFSAADTRLCHHLVPHLMEALAINRSLALAALPPSFGEQRYPGAIVALSGYILHAEAAFLDLLHAEWPQAEALHLPEALRAALVAQGRPAFLGEAIAVRRVLGGEPLFLRARTRLPVDRLTARELAIAQCLAAGDSYKTIARKLSIAPATVRNHIAGAHERLGIRSNAELVLHLKAAAF